MQVEEIKERETKSEEYVSKAQTGSVEDAESLHSVDDYRKLIEQRLSELDKESKNQKRLELKDSNVPHNYKDIEDIEILKRIFISFRFNEADDIRMIYSKHGHICARAYSPLLDYI